MEEKLKERVVGAAVLVAAAVIFVPMILSGPDEPPPAGPAEVRPEEPARASPGSAPGFSSRIVPLGEPPSPPEERAAPPPPVQVAPSPPPTPPPKPEVVEEPPEPAAGSVVANAAPRLAAGEGWVVQLGSFANSRNAHALRDRLRSQGYSAFAVSSGKGKDAVTRVYVGPEAEREGAERHVAKLLEATRLKGIVIRNPGT